MVAVHGQPHRDGMPVLGAPQRSVNRGRASSSSVTSSAHTCAGEDRLTRTTRPAVTSAMAATAESSALSTTTPVSGMACGSSALVSAMA